MDELSQKNILDSGKIIKISFEEILPYWKNELWPSRTSAIEPYSAIDINGNIDINICEIAAPKFWAYKIDDKIVGVISCQNTDVNVFRLRGIWVDSHLRQKGIGKSLTDHLKNYVSTRQGPQTSDTLLLWTMSRESNVNFYQSCGFKKKHRLDKYEYGPHWIMEQKKIGRDDWI